MLGEKCRILLVSQNVIKSQNIFRIGQAVKQSNAKPKACKIAVSSLLQGSQSALKFKLTSPNLWTNNQYIKQYWVICNSHEIQSIYHKNIKGVFVINEQPLAFNNAISSIVKVFLVRTLQEALNILSLNDSMLEERYKMERFLKISQFKYERALSFNYFIELTERFASIISKVNVNELCKFMKFAANRRLTCMKKYFNYWLILHYSHQIKFKQQEVIKGQYFVENSNKNLMTKCFKQWKLFHFGFKSNIN